MEKEIETTSFVKRRLKEEDEESKHFTINRKIK
jgi:hypothetical protein